MHRSILGTTMAALVACAALAFSASVADARAASSRWTPDRPAIINGHTVTSIDYDARWNAIVAVVARSSSGTALCGGVLIDERTVLTAAHCTFGVSGAVLAASSFDVVVGRRVANTTAGDRVPVEAVTRHPAFNRIAMRNDIAVLRLSRVSTVAVTPIPTTSAADEAWWGRGLGLAAGTDRVGPWIAGWGAVNGSGSSFPAELHEAKVPIASDAACAASNAPGQGADFDGNSMLCAGVPGRTAGAGVDACQGDSGGPLIVGDGDGAWRVVGLTSWGRDCGGPFYGVYTRVGRFATWIEPLRFRASATPPSDTAPPTAMPAPGGTPTTPPPGATPRPDGAGTTPPPAPGPGGSGDGGGSVPGDGTSPGDHAIGPVTIPGIAATAKPPTRPTLFRVAARGRGWATIAWRASKDDGRVASYRVLVRTSRGWRQLRTTTRTRITLKLVRGRSTALRVQAIDDSGARSVVSGVLAVRPA